eukprot:TRINITY_DN5458_c0_g1_i1.p3 TRINITY_DN5458_c0_g1~~TRINITY_DN5458_c0_g1_i1.p3  ORF type:complete len:155 (+),score=31.15 TRINITY_DN5458_c0_g1_i1:570-1034(+)
MRYCEPDGNEKRYWPVLEAMRVKRKPAHGVDTSTDHTQASHTSPSQLPLPSLTTTTTHTQPPEVDRELEAEVLRHAPVRRAMLLVTGLEVASFALYYVLLIALRLPTALTTPVPTGEFVHGLVEDNTHNAQSSVCYGFAPCGSAWFWHSWSAVL